MPDYGHELRFGAFITPSTGRPEEPVALARHSEEVGLDLVTFQDHPYQADFHDTWTLLTYVAAQTKRIQVSGNVLNLPLRPPAVLARAAASLDLLSGGRVALGIGAGGFWDAIEGMGGRRLSPGESVDALAEAIGVMRGIWDPTARGALHHDGPFYPVPSAKRGPVPAHAIPVWVGAYKPRMLRLVGRGADGWLPSQPYLKAGDLHAGNATVDAAAVAAGRDPREVVRLLNITPDLAVEDIVRLALEDGVSTFIIMSDDPAMLEQFGQVTAPAVRERVADGRSRAGTRSAANLRSSAVLAKRRPGIAYDDLPDLLATDAVEPGDHGYARWTSGYLRGAAPGLVLRARSVEAVRQAVEVARRHRHLPLGILSAGHGLSGRSLNDGGLVIDVSALDAVDVVDPTAGVVRIGPGARWVDVARALGPHGLAITSGDYGGVGVGGLATAGGVGWFAREHGLTIDHLRAVDVVLADGTLVHASPTHAPDLFWAMRGAGANFGVAVSFEFLAKPVGQIGFAQLVFDADDPARFLERWGAALETADRTVSGEVILGHRQPGRPRTAQAMLLVDSPDADEVLERLRPIAEVAPLLDQSVALVSYAEVMGAFTSDGPQRGQGQPRSHAGLLAHITPQFAEDAAELLDANASYFFQVRSVGGAVADVPSENTAYGFRSANFAVSAFGTASSRLDESWARLVPHFDGLYLSFETDTGPEVLARAFPPQHLERLAELKRRFDPSGLFRDNFYIAPVGED